MGRWARTSLGAFARGRRLPRIGRLTLVGLVGAGAAFVAGVVACTSGGSGVPSTSPIVATDESLAIGAQLYQNNCQLCHGPQGRGGELAPDLLLHVPNRNDGALFARISEGFPLDSDQKTMPAFGDQLTETERWHLVNFLRDEFGQGAPPIIPEDISP